MEESGITETVESGGHYGPNINVHYESCHRTLVTCPSMWRLMVSLFWRIHRMFTHIIFRQCVECTITPQYVLVAWCLI